MDRPLLRPRSDRKIAGVCAAFARAYGWDVTLVRLVLVALVLFGGGGVLAYIICWIAIPEDPIVLPTYPPASGQGYPPSVGTAYSQVQGSPSDLNVPPAA